MKGRFDIFLEHALELRGDRRAHQIKGVDRKERVPDIGLDLEAPDEPFGFDPLKLTLVLDPGQRLGGRFVIGGLEYPAEQDWDVFEFHSGAFFNRRDRLMAEESVGAAEIEQELRA